MALTITHNKTDNIADWTQADLDAQIALGNYPPGTLLADIVLPSDWNDDHAVTGTLGFSSIDAGTNTGALVIGNGGSLSATGTGTITATEAPAGTLTGTTLAANVVTSSLTSVGTIGTGVWNAGAVTSSGTITGTTFVPTGGTAPTNGMYLIGANNLGWAINSTGELQLTSSTLAPFANDGIALGTTARMWSDLFLASGGVINFNNGNVTLTHAAGSLTSNVPLTANSFIPSSSSAPTNGVYLPAANTLGFAVSSAGEVQLTSSALSPVASDGNALGTTALMWSDLFLASGAVINFNNSNVTLTHSTGALALNSAWNVSLSSTTTAATATIDAAALLGQSIITWTPAAGTNQTFVTGHMRKTIVNTTNGAITSPAHPIAGYDYLEVTGGTNAIDLMFIHEAKYKKTGTATVSNLSFYKPAIDSVAGTHTNITLYDGDMDLSAVTYTNAYLMNNANRSYLKFNTVGQIIGATGNEVPTSLNPGIVTGRYYFSAEWGSASSAAVTKDLLIACPPIIIPARTTFTRIGIRVVTGVASSTARFGIYKMENGVPTTKIYGSASATATTSNNVDVEDTISVTLEAGAYFLAYQNTGGATGATVKTLNFTDSYIMQIYGNASSQPDAATVEDWLYVANTGALPTSFGAVTRTRVGGALPAVYLKA